MALREIADQTVSPEDIKEDFIHSMQKYVEVDEPEPEAVPMIGTEEAVAPVLGQDDQSTDTVIDRMTEEEPPPRIGESCTVRILECRFTLAIGVPPATATRRAPRAFGRTSLCGFGQSLPVFEISRS